MTELYRAANWRDTYPIRKHTIEPGPTAFLRTGELSFRAAASQHSIPSVGLRVEAANGRALTYSSDTSPCEAIRDLARGSDVLIHEATFIDDGQQAGRYGHSTARQAGEIATAAAVGRLVFVHFTPARVGDLAELRGAAEAAFTGPIEVPMDGERLTLA